MMNFKDGPFVSIPRMLCLLLASLVMLGASSPEEESEKIQAQEKQYEEALAEALKTEVSLDVEDLPFDKALSTLAGRLGESALLINPDVLKQAGVDKKAKVSLKVEGMPFKSAFDLLWQQVGGKARWDGPITPTLQQAGVGKDRNGNRVLLLTYTFEEIETRVYAIRDLLVPLPQDLDLIAGDEKKKQAFRKDVVENVIQTITTGVGNPSHWTEKYKDTDLGGTIAELNGNLIIKTTPGNHAQFSGILKTLRAARGLMIRQEARILLLDEATLKAVVSETMPSLRLMPQGIAHNQRRCGADDRTQSKGCAGYALLTDEQAKALYEISRKSEATVALTSPRITQFNRARAVAFQGVQTAFVSGYRPTEPNQGDKQGEPMIETGTTGSLFTIESSVSSDRKFVTMSANLQVATESGPPVELQVSNAGKQAEVELLQIDRAVMETGAFSVPDKATIVFIGPLIQGRVGDFKAKDNSPAITDTAKYSDTRRVVLLVRQTIILQEVVDE